MRALGATTVPIPASAVDRSGLDGVELGAPAVAGNEYDKGATSFTGNLVFWARPNVIFANAKWFDGLSADQKRALRTAAVETYQQSAKTVRGSADDARKLLCERGFPIRSASSVAIAAFHQRLQPVIDQMAKDPRTKATIDAITSLRGSTDTRDVVAPCPTVVATAVASTGPTALDGKWTTSFTKAELIAGTTDSSEINDENWGDYTLNFDNGRFTTTQSNPVTSTSGSGTYTVQGDTVTQVFDHGETFVERWSIYKNTLTFKDGPTPSRVKPWTRGPVT